VAPWPDQEASILRSALQRLRRKFYNGSQTRSRSLSKCPTILNVACSGCACLHVLKLQCPAMHTLTGTFCNKLSDDTLAEAVKGASGIHALTLSVCLSLGDKGLAALGSLRNLCRLDISYALVEVRCFVSLLFTRLVRCR
jgi:hypothetical protein